MLTYERGYPIDITIDQPNFELYMLLDQELNGTKKGLEMAVSYVRDSFMINNDDVRFMFMQMGIKCINHMEILAKLLHLLHGSDDRYYDESNDDTPTKEVIPPLTSQNDKNPIKSRHINNDITACVLYHLQEETNIEKQYKSILNLVKDKGIHTVCIYMIEGIEENVKLLKGILHTLTVPNEIKDFGLGDSENAWSPNAGNYFDKPNPEFIDASRIPFLNDK